MRAIKITLKSRTNIGHRYIGTSRSVIIILQHTMSSFFSPIKQFIIHFDNVAVIISRVNTAHILSIPRAYLFPAIPQAVECILFLMNISRVTYTFFFFYTSKRAHFLVCYFFQHFLVYALISRIDARAVFSRSSVFSHFHFVLREKPWKLKFFDPRCYISFVIPGRSSDAGYWSEGTGAGAR